VAGQRERERREQQREQQRREQRRLVERRVRDRLSEDGAEQLRPCNDPSLSCEYGGDQDLQCDGLAVCTNGSWSVTEPPASSLCPTSPPGKDGCPDKYSSVPVGASCTGTTECAYPQGRCACAVSFGPVQLEDAGSSWVCEQPEDGCPEPRPQVGTSCSMEGLTCDYGTCTLPGGTAMACTNGTWAIQMSACAVAAGIAPSQTR